MLSGWLRVAELRSTSYDKHSLFPQLLFIGERELEGLIAQQLRTYMFPRDTILVECAALFFRIAIEGPCIR